ncbi:hypothetical protein CHELA1G11_11805 [Hyphomicrobiales bacterium]|nr:hypothetical protein CHELA1G11_11805 [Hyphomicrobiales bacterium]CAH1665302.1 hypothetical protein CHELA1G2_12502 [Hyphomicrobiales bacterium]
MAARRSLLGFSRLFLHGPDLFINGAGSVGTEYRHVACAKRFSAKRFRTPRFSPECAGAGSANRWSDRPRAVAVR